MSFFSSIAKFFGKSSIDVEIKSTDATNSFVLKSVPPVYNRNWRQGMWVMHENKIAIIFKIGEPCTIHYVDPHNGETIGEVQTSLGSLRQARYNEIPACRMGLSVEKALELGYGA